MLAGAAAAAAARTPRAARAARAAPAHREPNDYELAALARRAGPATHEAAE